MTFRRAFLLLLLAVCLLSGCVSLKREVPRKRMFGLEAGLPSGLQPGAEGVVFYIRPVSLAPPYDTKSFVYRKADGTWESDFHNEFVASPAALFTEQVRRWLIGAHGSLRVVEADNRARATHTLDIRVNALFGDYPEKGVRRAVLEMEFDVYAGGRPDGAAIFHRTYRREIPFEETGPAALVGGWNRALEEILTALVNDLNEAGTLSSRE